MKKIILMTMLMSAVFAQSDCNRDNWREYYNSEGRDMTDCDLEGANLEGALLEGALLELVTSERLKGNPASLPKGWSLVDGTLIEDRELKELSDELFKTISSNGRSIKKSEWRAWKKENNPQVVRGNMRFKSVDKNKNDGIGKSEFFKFYKRLIKD